MKGVEQPKNPKTPGLEMARQAFRLVKELDLTGKEKEKIMAMIDEAKGYEANRQLSKALNKYTLLLDFLKTKKVNSKKRENLEQELNLKKQYDEQFNILKETGVIRELSDGRWGMIDILAREQPIPSYEEIKARMEAKAEMLDKKREQGFTKLILVPIGMKLEDLSALAGKLILKKHKEGKLMATDGTKLELDENHPIYVNDEYKDADVNGSLVYGIKEFDKANHGGKTKEELINETGGWQIMFIEDTPDLPRNGKGKEIGDRKQLEAGLSPKEYLAKIQTNEQYANEQFTTPEAQLIYFMEYLQRNNQVIDDWDGNGNGCWNAGAYFKSGRAPFGYWNRNIKRFDLYWNFPVSLPGARGVRSSVGV